MKKSLVILLVAALLAGSALPAAVQARIEARYELKAGNAVFGNDLGQVNSKQSLFHRQTLNESDGESLNIDFPVSIAGIVAGPSRAAIGQGAGATANVLPFGPVNLAFPSIEETVDQSYSASETGFYTATFLGIPPLNSGAAEVMSGIYAANSPVGPPASLVGSDMMFPEMNNIIPGYNMQKATAGKPSGGKNATQDNVTAKGNDTAEINVPAFFNKSIIKAQLGNQTGVERVSISGQEITGVESSVPLNYTGRNATGQNLSYPYFNFKAKAGRISNMSLFDRMWRNAHLGTMGRAYEGDTASPTWILPTRYSTSAIAMYNWSEVNGIALNQTLPGTHLLPRFWDIGIATPYNMSKVTIGPQKSATNNTTTNITDKAGNDTIKNLNLFKGL